MASKSLFKIIVALGILAFVLIFLGVNFVPGIFASSSNAANEAVPVVAIRSNYTNENYQRSIVPQLSLAGSDWIERHPALETLASYYAGSDWIERHPSNYFTNSDWIERHPALETLASYYAGSDWIERHPSNYFTNSDWVERHPTPPK